MSKRGRIRLLSFLLAAFCVMGGFLCRSQLRLRRCERQLDNCNHHAFYQLVTGVREVSNALEKSLYATSPSMVSALCTDVYGKAMSAHTAMGQLPLSGVALDRTSGFLGKIGDYAFMLSKSGSYTREQYDNLQALARAARDLADQLEALMTDVDAGALTLSELERAEAEIPRLSDSIQTIESEFPEIPHLIYDGPFSEHILQKTPVFLADLEEISQEQAAKAAAAALGVETSDLTAGEQRGGTVPVYGFSCRINGADKYVEITRQGGVLLNILSPRKIERENIAREDALRIALRYLEKQGFSDMAQSYYMVHGGVLTANFAYCQQDVICYTDLVKVSVALDNGEITGFESLGYVMSHTRRDLPEAEVDRETAANQVGGSLTILSHDLSVIPTDGQYEKFCHEFKCENEGGQHYLIYVNAVTGQQEKILILLEDESGTLTI